MRALLVVPLALAGCKEVNPEFCKAHPEDERCDGVKLDGGPSDGPDADIDADPTIDARVCFGADGYSVCLKAPPMSPATLTAGLTIDTTPNASGSLCLPSNLYPDDWMTAGQPDSCFIIGNTITVPNVTVTGTRPLVLLASNTINVTGPIDAASHRTGPKLGPGAATQTQCTVSNDPPETSVDGGGGGAGGSFMTKGGDGGDGLVAKGTAATQDQTGPTKLRAGCKGQAGGTGEGAAGAAGEGGGAIYLLAGVKIAFSSTGAINVSGSAGGACGREAGGGGGGTGGMIVLYAPSITATTTSVLMANGGGGSSGGNNGGGVVGNEPSLTSPLTRTASASGPGGAGDGGGGGAQGLPANPGTNGGTNLGGGGGGGGLGYIQANVTIADVIASPTVTVIP